MVKTGLISPITGKELFFDLDKVTIVIDKVMKIQNKIIKSNLSSRESSIYNDYFNRSKRIHEAYNNLKVEGVNTTYKKVIAASELDNIDDKEISEETAVNLMQKYISINGKKDIAIENISEMFKDYKKTHAPSSLDTNDKLTGVRTLDIWVGNHQGAKPKNIVEHLDNFVTVFNNISNIENGGPLVWALTLHYYFEAVHPFEDFNGRIGRGLIHWYLMKNKYPYDVYISTAINLNRKKYDEAFISIREEGENDITGFITRLLEIIVLQLKSLVCLRNVEEIVWEFHKYSFKTLERDILMKLISLEIRGITRVQLVSLYQVYKKATSKGTFYSSIEKLHKFDLWNKIGERNSILDISEKTKKIIQETEQIK